MRLSERLRPEHFQEDEVVGFSAADADSPEVSADDRTSYVPERIFTRLQLLGAAYSLHFPALIDSHSDSELNAAQCENFLEELHFLANVVSDAALHAVVGKLVPLVEQVAHTKGAVLKVGPP